ncbi:hypothetical protein KFE25_007592 [Diacronema lutheri]|uniref:Uncharacterized protein n=1 Tax=Diacronema lutheri TaxID=2081491 RepID=A0A8J6CDX7_DIALT|nr:hypothetical protein KFE25_007592 [Diacronema lutheri]
MEGARSACAGLQAEYTQCMRTWFKDKFLQGEFIPNSDCHAAFEELRDCISLHFQNEAIKASASRPHGESPPAGR